MLGHCIELTVYPRVGGGTLHNARPLHRTHGLSPRGRGNHHGRADDPASLRSIPAWAGEPGYSGACLPAPRVYPRVGGGTFAGVIHASDGRVYPRVGGGTPSIAP